jgi:DNA-damage-inducible protein D
MNDNTPHLSPFEVIRKVNDDGKEYWSARDLCKILGYAKWDKFKVAIERAKEACQHSNQVSLIIFSKRGN